MTNSHGPAHGASGPLPLGPIRTVEYHTAGEPFRIVVDGVPQAEGATVLERRTWAQQNLDRHRAFLVNEPRGHADMYGGFVTPADDDGASLGVLFFHKDGFSTACGHGTIALATWAVDNGLVDIGLKDAELIDPGLIDPGLIDTGLNDADGGGSIRFAIDVPSGRLPIVADLDRQGRVERVRFWNVDSFVTDGNLEVDTSAGRLSVDLSFGGAFYGSVALDNSTLQPDVEHLGRLIEVGREIKAALADHDGVMHRDSRLSGLYGVIFHQDQPLIDGDDASTVRQRNVTVFADGEVDRSPCGSGTSARLAVLENQGRLDPGALFFNQGIAGGVFEAAIEQVDSSDGQKLVKTSVAGSAYRTGEATFTIDDRDQIGLGFQLR